jgi:hypothetical protein
MITPPDDFQLKLVESRQAIDGLRHTLGEVLMAHKIYRVPKLDGTGESIRVPKGLCDLKASDIFNLCELVSKLRIAPVTIPTPDPVGGE